LTLQSSSISPSLQWDANNGVDVAYSISNATTNDATTVDLYWASGNQFSDIIGGPIANANTNVASGTAIGTYGPFNVDATTLGTQPAGATYLLAVADPNNVLGTFNPSTNVIALTLPVLSLSPGSLPYAEVGAEYNQTISASGGTEPYSYAVTSGSLPDGLSLNSATGDITGIPTENGTFDFTITATDANNFTSSQNYSSWVDDLNPLELQPVGGQFTLDPQTNLYTDTGTILIGLTPSSGQSFSPMLELSGSASFDDSTIQLSGTFSEDIGSNTSQLFQGTWTIDVGNSGSSSIQLNAHSQGLTLAGLPVSIDSIDLSTQGIAIQGSMNLPTETAVAFSALNSLSLNILVATSGVSVDPVILASGLIAFGNGNGIDFGISSMTVQYQPATDTQDDSFILQGKTDLSTSLGTFEVDFSDPNYILIQDGNTYFNGTVSVNDIAFGASKNWGIENASLTMNTKTSAYTGSLTLQTPLCNVQATMGFAQGQLDSFGVAVQKINLEIPGTPLFLQSIGGSVTNLSDGPDDPLTFTATIGLTVGPTVTLNLPSSLGGSISGAVTSLTIQGTYSANAISGSVMVSVAGGLESGQGSITVNTVTGAFDVSANLSCLNGLVTTSADLTEGASGDLNMSGTASVTLPGFSLLGFSYPATQLASGQILFQYIPSDPLTDDYIIATGTDSLFGSGSFGVKVDLAGNVTTFDPTVVNTQMMQSIVITNSNPDFAVSTNNNLQELIDSVANLTPPPNNSTLTIDLGPGVYSDMNAGAPTGVTLDLVGIGGTADVQGNSPALTVSSGTVTVSGVTLSTETDSTTILVTGGSLTLRNDTIQESTVGAEAAISISGGTLDLGTVPSPGNNILNINGTGSYLANQTSETIPEYGDIFSNNGVAFLITTTTLSNWTVNAAKYSQSVNATGGTGHRTFSVTSGTLPPGLIFNGSTGVVSGKPTMLGTYNFTITTTDSIGGNSSRAYAVTINSPPSIITTNLPTWTANANFNQTVAVTNGTAPFAFAVSAGSLPSGLTLNPGTGVIGGRPAIAGTFHFTIKVTDAAKVTATRAFTLTIDPAIAITTNSLVEWTADVADYNQTVAAAHGTGSHTFAVTKGSLPAGLSLNPASGSITGIPTASGRDTFNITATDSVGGTVTKSLTIVINPVLSLPELPSNWTVNGARYIQAITVSGGTGGHTLTLSAGSLPPGLTFNVSSGALTGIADKTGTFDFTITATDSVGASGSRAYALTINSSPSITTTSLPTWTAGVNFGQTIAVADGTAAFAFSLTAGALPSGLTLNTRTGIISGKPIVPGTFHFTVKVTDAAKVAATHAYTLLINPAIAITTNNNLPSGKINIAYDQMLAATGGTGDLVFAIASGSLPPGLSLDPTSGAITGMPTTHTGSPFSFTITVTDAVGGTASKTYRIVIDS
jgi:hypothetical protein